MAVREAFRHLADDIGATPGETGWARCTDGHIEDYARCFDPLIKHLVEQWCSNSVLNLHDAVDDVMQQFEKTVSTSPISLTSPWIASEITAHVMFKSVISSMIEGKLAEESKHWVMAVSLPVSSPLTEPPSSAIASNPEIREMLKDHPEFTDIVRLFAHDEKAVAEAEVNFRQREKAEDWLTYKGAYPWDSDGPIENTTCPWWVAGAEYAFHRVAEWRRTSPMKPEIISELLPAQIKEFARSSYFDKVLFYDLFHGFNSNTAAEKVMSGLEDQFADFVFAFAIKKFSDNDLEEWRRRAISIQESTTHFAPGRTQQPLQQNLKCDAIEKALAEIADAWPKNQEKVFRFLDEHIAVVLSLLDRMTEQTSIEKWAKENHLSRTQVFEFRRSNGQPVEGKLSKGKCAEITKAVIVAARKLGLLTGTPDSDS